MNGRFKFRVWSRQSNNYIKEKMFYIDKFGGVLNRKYKKAYGFEWEYENNIHENEDLLG